MDLFRERLVVGRERLARERVRISRRTVTEFRTVQVPVRVEQLVVTHEPVDPVPTVPAAGFSRVGGRPAGTVGDDTVGDEIVVVLHEEIPEISLRVVPVERVTITRRTVQDEVLVSADLATEVADVIVERTPEPVRHRAGDPTSEQLEAPT